MRRGKLICQSAARIACNACPNGNARDPRPLSPVLFGTMVDAGLNSGWTAISLVGDQLLGMGFSERDVAKCSAAGCPDVESALALLQLESDDTVLSDETAPQRSLHGAESELLTFRAGEAVCVRDILGRSTLAELIRGLDSSRSSCMAIAAQARCQVFSKSQSKI